MDGPALVIGAGGLGCPALLGLVAGGARRLMIVDDDAVDLSNLPRQVLYDSGALGVAKTAAASWSLRGRFPARANDGETLDIETLAARLEPDAIPELLARHRPRVVLECSDSPTLKFAVHDACVSAGVPVVIGGVVTWAGQAMAIDPRRRGTACYRCLFEAPPPPELSPACASVGVFGPAAGAVGHMMAALAHALLDPARSDGERSPAGCVHHFDLLGGSARRLAPKPRPGCSSCGRNFNEALA